MLERFVVYGVTVHVTIETCLLCNNMRIMHKRCSIITDPPTHSVGGRLVTFAGVLRRLSSSVTLHGAT